MKAGFLCLHLVSALFFASIVYADSEFGGSFFSNEFLDGYVEHRADAGTADASGWFHARSSKGRFAVTLPFRFQDWSVEVPEWKGASHSIGSVSPKGITFLVSEFPRFDESEEMQSKSFTKAVMRGRTVRYMRFFEYGGHAASQTYVRGRKRSAIIRFVILPDRYYRLAVEFPKTASREARSFQRKFFESLQTF